MKYRVFVSSTMKDLGRQREKIIRRLREANLNVVAMEDGTASPEHPADWSVKQLRNADFCVAVVAFQRGTLSTNDPQQRSITQIEIDDARRLKIPILIYLLRDTPENIAVWPAEFTCLEDEAVVRWREYLSREFTCTFFDADEIPDPLPAIARQVFTLENNKTRSARVALAMLVVFCLISAISLWSFTSVQDALLNRILAIKDPSLFRHSLDGKYRIAQLLDGASEIRATNFGETIRGCQTEFSLFANTFGSFRDHVNDFREAAKRGVRLRFIVTDFSEDNRQNWESFQVATGSRVDFEEAVVATRNVRNLVQELSNEFPGRVEIRLNHKPIFFTLWLRDPNDSNGVAHLGVHYYQAQRADWPAFRVSTQTSPSQLMKLRDQFEIIWDFSRKNELSDLSDSNRNFEAANKKTVD